MSDNLKECILEAVKDDLAAIESALIRNLTPQVELVRDVAGHLLFSGGKRLRPLLMVLSSRACGFEGERAVHFSTLFEYLHAATLLHDDLVDGAALRRGRTAAHKVFGNEIAVLTGDFLLARSLSIASDTGDPRVIGVIAGITEAMAQGEIEQLHRKGDLTLTEEAYREVIRRKTAVLFQGACRTGALVAGAGSRLADALDAYGYHLGLAFQMADDLLDYLQEESAMGKAAGADLREGKLTLPVIVSLKNASVEDGAFIRRMMGNAGITAHDFKRFRDILFRSGGIDHTRQAAESHVAEAESALSVFSDTPVRNTLSAIARYALVRGH